MPEHACRWNLTPGLGQRRRVVLGHDVGLSDKWGTNRDAAGALAPIPLARPKPVTAVSRHPRNSTTQSQNDGSRLRARLRKAGVTPGVMMPGQEWRRAGLLDPAPATERDQTKLYGFVVNSWSDKVLSVQRIWTRTRTR